MWVVEVRHEGSEVEFDTKEDALAFVIEDVSKVDGGVHKARRSDLEEVYGFSIFGPDATEEDEESDSPTWGWNWWEQPDATSE